MENYFFTGENKEYGKFKFSVEKGTDEILSPYLDKELILGARPEHIDLTKDTGLKAKVMVTELLGSEIHVHVYVQNDIHTVKIEAPTTIKAGDIISMIPDSNQIHLFDLETEEALF